ncbi:DUF3572 domain-containing protein [Aquabacter cavernae]|uniref:DUF3572 domain-containing protein n=1 Tax=Aquabacter cavernae TaxID=2496029 RepID=UPI000F8EF451|nr:DUF3572 domain-containing protein [Aquabacter cavernae]
MPIREKTPSQARAREAAGALAIRALGWLAQDMERIGGFLAQSGMGPGDLRVRAQEPAFGAAILSYLLSDEALLLAFAADTTLRPQDVVHAFHVLEPPFDPDAPVRRGD